MFELVYSTVKNTMTISEHPILIFHVYVKGAHGGAVGGTALQAGRSWVQFLMVSLEFFIDIILPAALWSWG